MVVKRKLMFVSRDGEPLPEWLQPILRGQAERLLHQFPALDLALIQNALDDAGQRVLDRMQTGPALANPESYARVTAGNALLTLLRNIREQTVDNEMLFYRAAPAADQPTDAQLMWDKLRDYLDPDEEVLLVQHIWLDKPHREIAAALGVKEATIRSRYSRILSKLREVFA